MADNNIILATLANTPELLKIGEAGANVYKEMAKAVSNRHVGGSFVYTKNTPLRDVTLLRNPMMRRYSEYDSAVGDVTAPLIGEAYDVYEREHYKIPTFLDQVGGIAGFYWEDGYKKVAVGLGGRMKSVGGSLNEIRLEPVFRNIRSLYWNGIYGIDNETVPDKPYFYNSEDLGHVVVDENGRAKLKQYKDKLFIEEGANLTKDQGSLNIVNFYDEREVNKEGKPGERKYYSFISFNELTEIEDEIDDTDGIVFYTNELFKNGKINSIVSRFETREGDSKGKAIKTHPTYIGHRYDEPEMNGFYNPYFRAWTNHKQYTKYQNLTSLLKEENGKPIAFEEIQRRLGSLRPNDGAGRLARFGSREGYNDDMQGGFEGVKIPPTIGDNTPDVWKCMFSIENLAWKDINKGAKVDNRGVTLSEKQTGPNGGRIMWFPPYNLKFSENVRTDWNQNSFIGRGEKIYTYKDTERTGQLDFVLLVDHPSRVDEWGARNVPEDFLGDDSPILRYFSGEGVPELKDGYAVVAPEDEKPVNPSSEPKPFDNTKEEYFIFFPNYYTGKEDAESIVINKLACGESYGEYGAYEYKDHGMSLTKQYGKDKMIKGKFHDWDYWIDEKKYSGIKLKYDDNYFDNDGFSLNRNPHGEVLDEIFKYFGVGNIKNYNNITLYDLRERLKWCNKGEIERIEVLGSASSHGYEDDNIYLATNRANTISRLISYWMPGLNIEEGRAEIGDVKEEKSVSSLIAKFGRSVHVIVHLNQNYNDKPTDSAKSGNVSETIFEFEPSLPQDRDADRPNGPREYYKKKYVTGSTEIGDEYLYFVKVFNEDNLVRRSIMEKVRFFHPAYHSMTPEGFNARLTFLHQCTRQGPTTSSSDSTNTSNWGAGNMSFGRAPICVLRIGDFYNTKICINSVNITYDGSEGVIWDLNRDGVGIQPMYATVSIGFTFLGGQDISGPIARLQNAVSHNFYANTSVYDKRADYRNGWISENDDSAMIWDPYITGQDNGKYSSTTFHRQWGTLPKSKNETREEAYNKLINKDKQ